MQADLFTPQRARRSDPSTSHAAAARAGALALDHQQRILSALRRALLPLGAEQIAVLADLQAYQVRKRLPELERMRMAEVFPGERRTSSGRTERLWIASALVDPACADYSAAKREWLAANPDATPEQTEAALRDLAERLGV